MLGSQSLEKPLKVRLNFKTLNRIQQKRVKIHCVHVHLYFISVDESFAVLHNKRGILGMANKGPHSNGSQFYITLQPTPWMDRTYVAFGFVS